MRATKYYNHIKQNFTSPNYNMDDFIIFQKSEALNFTKTKGALRGINIPMPLKNPMSKTGNAQNRNAKGRNPHEPEMVKSKPKPFLNCCGNTNLLNKEIDPKKGTELNYRANGNIKRVYHNSKKDFNDFEYKDASSNPSSHPSSRLSKEHKILKEIKGKSKSFGSHPSYSRKSKILKPSSSRKRVIRKPKPKASKSMPAKSSSHSKPGPAKCKKKVCKEKLYILENSCEEYQGVMDIFNLLNDSTNKAMNDCMSYQGPLKISTKQIKHDAVTPHPNFVDTLTQHLFKHFSGVPVVESAMRAIEESSKCYLEKIANDIETYFEKNGRLFIKNFDIEELLKKEKGDLKKAINDNIANHPYSFLDKNGRK